MAGETAQDFNRTLDELEKGIKRVGTNRELKVAATMLLDHLEGIGPGAFLPLDLFTDKLREAVKRAGRGM